MRTLVNAISDNFYLFVILCLGLTALICNTINDELKVRREFELKRLELENKSCR